MPFERYVEANEAVLRRALVAGFGAELGREAAVEALARGWERWDRISVMDNPGGYLYRIGHNWAKGRLARAGTSPEVGWPAAGEPTSVDDPAPVAGFEPALGPALRDLSERQRQVVVLVTGFGLSHAETAELLGISRSTVQNHVERGLEHLRRALGVR